MNDSNIPDIKLILIALFFGAFFLLTPRLRPFVSIIFFLLFIIAIIALIYYSYRFIADKKKQVAFNKTIGGKIDKNIQLCNSQVKKNEKEIEEIKTNIQDINQALKKDFETNKITKTESEKLVSAFQMELKLREEKIIFYSSCMDKLKTLQYNYNLTEELEKKKKKLKEFQENHYEDISDMEAMKTELEMDQHYLETIENLSTMMLKSNSVDTAQQLHLELNTITKELRQL